MTALIDSFVSLKNVPNFLAFFLLSLLLFGAFKSIYQWVTPYHELNLIRNGNVAASVSLSGALLGYALVLASVVIHSLSLFDLALWGLIGLGIQVGVYFVASQLLPDLAGEIERGSVAHGILLAVLSLCVGLINAACLTPAP